MTTEKQGIEEILSIISKCDRLEQQFIDLAAVKEVNVEEVKRGYAAGIVTLLDMKRLNPNQVSSCKFHSRILLAYSVFGANLHSNGKVKVKPKKREAKPKVSKT